MSRALHVGSGGQRLPEWLAGYNELSLDVDPSTQPDICASMLNIGEVGEFDCVYLSHVLEHVYPHEAPKAVSEFYRVLKSGGFLMLFVPDLEDVKATEDVLFESEAGPITGLDLFYGHRVQLNDRPYMAHKNGFTADSMRKLLGQFGFTRIEVKRMPAHNLMAVAVK